MPGNYSAFIKDLRIILAIAKDEKSRQFYKTNSDFISRLESEIFDCITVFRVNELKRNENIIKLIEEG